MDFCLADEQQEEVSSTHGPLSVSLSLLGVTPIFQWGVEVNYALDKAQSIEAAAVGYSSITSSDERDVYSLRYKSFIFGLKHYYFAGAGMMDSTWKSQSDSYRGTDGRTQYLNARDIVLDSGVGSRWQGATNFFCEIDWLSIRLPLIHIKKPDPVYRDDATDKPAANTPAHFSLFRAKIGYVF